MHVTCVYFVLSYILQIAGFELQFDLCEYSGLPAFLHHRACAPDFIQVYYIYIRYNMLLVIARYDVAVTIVACYCYM
jgi:Tat protein secretion system quality control protein TatD with DNase activity